MSTIRVFVTGASGFVGSYTVRALLAAGHRPRALVRDPGKTTKVLQTIGVAAEDVELVPGDMLDADTVAEALDGCDAAIHAAAAIGVTGAAGDLVEVNVRGTRNVVGGAVARGLDPVIHVSTIGVFVPPTAPHKGAARHKESAPVITAGGALARPRTAYGRSKLAAERYVRGLQADGAAVTIVYPGGVCGPHQPTLGALMEGLAAALGKVWPLPGGGVSVIDVRDLGEALARSVEVRQGPSRWVLGGHYLTWPQYADLCDRLTGVRCRRVRVTEERQMPTLVQRTFGPVFHRVSGAAWFSKVGPRIVPPVDRTLHRLSGGRLLLGQLLVPSLVLTTTGAVSGLPRRTPLACLPEEDGGFVVVGSNFGRENHPAWTGNLLKDPKVGVSFRGRTVPVTAHQLDDTERAEIWPRLVRVWPVYDRYVERTDRQLKIFRLTPLPDAMLKNS